MKSDLLTKKVKPGVQRVERLWTKKRAGFPAPDLKRWLFLLSGVVFLNIFDHFFKVVVSFKFNGKLSGFLCIANKLCAATSTFNCKIKLIFAVFIENVFQFKNGAFAVKMDVEPLMSGSFRL